MLRKIFKSPVAGTRRVPKILFVWRLHCLNGCPERAFQYFPYLLGIVLRIGLAHIHTKKLKKIFSVAVGGAWRKCAPLRADGPYKKPDFSPAIQSWQKSSGGYNSCTECRFRCRNSKLLKTLFRARVCNCVLSQHSDAF